LLLLTLTLLTALGDRRFVKLRDQIGIPDDEYDAPDRRVQRMRLVHNATLAGVALSTPIAGVWIAFQ
jgi:hypothetical protein